MDPNPILGQQHYDEMNGRYLRFEKIPNHRFSRVIMMGWLGFMENYWVGPDGAKGPYQVNLVKELLQQFMIVPMVPNGP